ncbi:uncharacterized protein [Amphiura filiformis]|uniref:uncharacterized protein n=1 Tax=Amphiura filiformis TaxID=82378 RepID=UPI003B22548C
MSISTQLNSMDRPTWSTTIMACATTFVLSLLISLPTAMCQKLANGPYHPAETSPRDDPGHNTHQETVIFACLGATVFMVILVIVLLWFFVDRTKQTIRKIESMLPELIEKFKNDEFIETGPGHLSGTFDAKGEFEAGFKGSADFLDATGDRVKLTSYSKRDDTVTTVVTVDGPRSTGLTSYTRKVNGSFPIDNHTEPATSVTPYAQIDHHVKPVDAIDGPMTAHARVTSTSSIPSHGGINKSNGSVPTSKLHHAGVTGGMYQVNPPNHTNGYSPSHVSANSFSYDMHDGQYRRKKRHTPPISPKDPEKAALYDHNFGPLYSEPPAYDAAYELSYENKALSIDKRATLPISSLPRSKEKVVDNDEDTTLKRKRRSSYYVESHV